MLAEKRGQTELSFGMIFSIILIVIFLVVGFYAVRAFIGIGQQTETAKFYDDLQDDINKAWKSSKVSEQQEYLLPGKIKKVCFVDFAASAEGRNQQIYENLNFGTDSLSHNILFYPTDAVEGLSSKKIEHIDLIKITENENPYCIENTNGKVKLTIKKNIGENLVLIERQ
ncbi:MAG TPA: hypothetical protein VJH65_02850 [Candidatus Nanoarchaeia archaeon]|nr:hypothetical protein [Candidatus Nanoarchaeia archaeon]